MFSSPTKSMVRRVPRKDVCPNDTHNTTVSTARAVATMSGRDNSEPLATIIIVNGLLPSAGIAFDMFGGTSTMPICASSILSLAQSSKPYFAAAHGERPPVLTEHLIGQLGCPVGPFVANDAGGH